MSVHRRVLPDGTKRWDVRYRLPGSRRERMESFDDEARARYRDAEIRLQKSDGRLRSSSNESVRVRDAWMAWLEIRRKAVARGQLKPKGLAGHEDQWRLRIEARFGDVLLTDLRADEIQSWIDRLHQGGLGPSTLRWIHRPLKLAIDHAIRTGMFAGPNPAAGIEMPPLPDVEHVYLSRKEVFELVELLGEQGDVALLLAFLGLRFGELVGLRVRDVDLEGRRVHVRRSITQVRGILTVGTPKSKAGIRSIPIPMKVLGPVLEKRLEGKSPNDAVVTSPKGGLLQRGNWVRATNWYQAIVDIGRPDMTIHSLRHTYASLARSAGADLRLIQKTMGHANVVVTAQIYSDLFDDELDAVADALDLG